MSRRCFFYVPLVLATCAAAADEPSSTERVAKLEVSSEEESIARASAESKQAAETGPKALSGMSILGNQEAPKALVIVPWKSSKLGDGQGLSQTLDDGRQPVDKDVFMRELAYYEIRSE